MYSLIDGVYDAFTELMYYFYFQFNVSLVLFLIVLINCAKVTLHFFDMKKSKVKKSGSYGFDLVISILAGIGLFNSLMFQGVLADISTEYSEIWFGKVFALCVVTFILFIIQFIFCHKISR